jgi:hypothetical protein
MRPTFAALLCAVTLITPVMAGSGPTKLKQPKVFPITISKPGRYLLVSNLNVRHPNTTAIRIMAANVTLDMNGFSILGPCPCHSIASGIGLDAGSFGYANTTVLNGTVQGMGSDGIFVVSGRVEGVAAVDNGGSGISFYGAGIAVNSTAEGNGGLGLAASDGTITNSVAFDNRLTGIAGFGTVTGCTARRNRQGIVASGAVTLSTASGNPFGDISAPGIAGHNICGSDPCP